MFLVYLISEAWWNSYHLGVFVYKLRKYCSSVSYILLKCCASVAQALRRLSIRFGVGSKVVRTLGSRTKVAEGVRRKNIA